MTNFIEDKKPVIINVNDFGIKPDSGKDAAQAVQEAIYEASNCNAPVILNFEKGQYDFYSKKAARKPYYISNTASEDENPDVTKTIGLFLKGIKNAVIEGNNSLFIFHGKMTPIIIDGCENIEIRNIHIDFARPTMSEMTAESIGENYIDFRIHNDSWYEINNNKFVWVGEGWSYTEGPSQEYDRDDDMTWRTWNPASSAIGARELEPFLVRFYYDNKPSAKIGRVFQMRDGLRDQVGTFIHKSRNIGFKNIGFHYMHGLGIVGQYSENLNFERLDCSPRPETGRTAAAFADFFHMSGCRGKITVRNSRFSGAHDDPINVHGTHLSIMEMPSLKKILVRFMHPQSYGFDAVFPGDSIEFINPDTLTAMGSGKVVSAEMTDYRDILITLENPVPEGVMKGTAVENITWTPEVEIYNNYFSRVPTRGILVTTRRKVRIEDNTFYRMQMSGILIASDAKSWYESGMARDVAIKNNRFIKCEAPVIYIAPENSIIDQGNPVHRNIIIEDNMFEVMDNRVLWAKSTQGLSFVGNRICGIGPVTAQSTSPTISLLGCSDVKIMDNEFKDVPKTLMIDRMSIEDVEASQNQDLNVI